ncbi:MAG: hypothetical protein LAN62_03980 [Acidobacteriia bacterium]|nr:hypothetical protein [Terriglobia bacterium]
MKKRFLLLAGLSTAVMFTLSLVFAQSLGDLARAERAKREKEGKKPVKVFTNDNLPARPPGEGPTAASSMSSAPPPPSEAPPAEQATSAQPATESAPSEAGGEEKQKTREYWQDQFKSAHKNLADAEEQQRVAEDELSLLQIQQARELSSDAQSQLEAQIKSKQAGVQAKRADTDKARKDLENLEKDFKDSGAPADWGKTD